MSMLLGDYLTLSAQKFPDKIACISAQHRCSYSYIEAQSNQLAHALLDAGVQPGDRVAVFMDNSIETVVSIFGIVKARAAFVLINPATKSDKAAYVINNCSAVGLIIDPRYHAVLETVETAVPSVGFVIFSDGHNPQLKHPEKMVSFNFHDLKTFSPNVPSRRGIDLDLSSIIYTSGSTGQPKGVIDTHQSMDAAVESIIQYLESVPSDIILTVLSMSFVYGMLQVLTTMRVGGTLVIEKAFTYPYPIIQKIKDEQVTGFAGVPTIFAILLDQLKNLDPSDFDSVRYLTNAGAALSPAHLLRLRGLFTHARIFSMYGLTECKRVTYLPPEEIERRSASVGRGMPNEELWIVDDDGYPVGPGVVGELVVRGAHVMKGYWGLPDETNRVLRPGRYPWEKVLYTGDLFKMDEAGYLYFVARKDDIIKTRGEKVSPREVENVIYELPEVKEVVVLGIPDPISGEVVQAEIVKCEGSALLEKTVINHCKQRLEPIMVPKFVVFRENLPKTTNGKLIRLRETSPILKVAS